MLTVRDLRSLRAVLRHISTSNAAVLDEVFRLDALLADIITRHTERTHTNATDQPAA